MITDIFLRAVNTIVYTVVSALPDFDLPYWVCESRTQPAPGSTMTGTGCIPGMVMGFGPYLVAIDKFLPISEALTLVPLQLGALLVLFAFRVVVFTYSLVRGGGGGS